MEFYEPNSDIFYLKSMEWKEERNIIKSQGGKLLNVDQANQYDLERFFLKCDKGIKPIPLKKFNYFVLPYELNEELDNGLEADEICINIISDNIQGDILVASTDRDKCCFISCRNLNDEIIYSIYHTHINTPFIVFDDTYEFFAIIDFDLPFQIIGYRGSIKDSHHYISNKVGAEGWQTIFKRYGSYVNMPKFFRDYYYFLLPNSIKEHLKLNFD